MGQQTSAEVNRILETLGRDVVALQQSVFNKLGGPELTGTIRFVEATFSTTIDALIAEINSLATSTNWVIDRVNDQFDKKLYPELMDEVSQQLRSMLYHAGEERVYDLIKQIDDGFEGIAKLFIPSLLEHFGDAGNLETSIRDLLASFDSTRRLGQAIVSENVDHIVREARNVANDLNAEFGRLASEVSALGRRLIQAEKATEDFVQSASGVVRNSRMLWDEFTAPGLGFNRKTLAMIVRQDTPLEERLGITPCIARAKQASDALAGMGIRLPVVAVADRLVASADDAFKRRNPAIRFFESDLGYRGNPTGRPVPGIQDACDGQGQHQDHPRL